MSITNVSKDLEQLRMTVTAEFTAPLDQTWQLWADPRKLEKWWGPPSYPATVTEHDLSPGGKVAYFMTSPEGHQHGGWWRVIEVESPRLLVFEDGFSDPTGEPSASMPTMIMSTSLADRGDGGTIATMVTAFSSVEAMQQLLEMGMEEGLREAMSQMDALVTA